MWNIYLYFIILKLFTNFQNIYMFLVKIVDNASLRCDLIVNTSPFISLFKVWLDRKYWLFLFLYLRCDLVVYTSYFISLFKVWLDRKYFLFSISLFKVWLGRKYFLFLFLYIRCDLVAILEEINKEMAEKKTDHRPNDLRSVTMFVDCLRGHLFFQ